jgi:hypothetical protein
MRAMQPFSQRASWIASALAAIALVAVSASVAATPQATLKVTHRLDMKGPLYIEGAYYYLRTERQGRSATRRLRQPTTTLRLVPGRYRLRGWARPCDGNCNYLDPPTDHCTAAVRLRAGRTARIRITARAGTPCRIDLT